MRPFEVDRLQQLPIDELDRMAFGVVQGVQRLPLDQIEIRYPDDYHDALEAVEDCPWCYEEALESEPIDVQLERGVYWLEDGHHRFVTARARGDRDILADLTIKDNPVVALTQRQASAPDWYYRLSRIGDNLPLSWSYGDQDEAVPGFQVWIHPWQVLSAILGYDMDGTYSPQDGYDRLLLVATDKIRDSVDPWCVVLPEDVIETRTVDTLSIQSELIERLEREFGEDWEYDAQQYLEERDDEFERWLLSKSEPAQIGFVDTFERNAISRDRDAGPQELELERLFRDLLPGTRFANRVFAVGGYVRDQLQEKEPADLDVAVELQYGAQRLVGFLIDAFDDAVSDPEPLTYDFPIWSVRFLRDVEWKDETYAVGGAELDLTDTQTIDRLGDESTTVFGPVQRDVERRDFTVNMLYKDLTSGEILDPTGVGQYDIERGLLRTRPNEDAARSFREQPRRVLRLIRFMLQYGWQPDPETEAALMQSADVLVDLSRRDLEREFGKLQRRGVLEKAISLLRQYGLLEPLQKAWARERNATLYSSRRQSAVEPQVGDQVRSIDYTGQPYLYHWTSKKYLPEILEQGLMLGSGAKWKERCTQRHCVGRVFFSTEPDKWALSYPDPVVVIVSTDDVNCYYDGGEWIDQNEEDYIEGRLSDCYTEEPVPPELIRSIKDNPVVALTQRQAGGYERQYEPGPLTHRRQTRDIPHAYALLFSDDPERNQHYGPHVWTLTTELPEPHDDLVRFAMGYFDVDEEEARELIDPPNIVDDAGAWEDMQFCYEAWESFEEPGYRTHDGAVVLDREGVELIYSYDDPDTLP